MASVNIDAIPNPKEIFSFATDVAMNAVWADDPMTQIVTNAVIVVIMMLSSSVGFVVGIPIATAALILLGVGIARLVLGHVLG